MMKRRLVVGLSLVVPFVLRADTPDIYAIRGARIVTAAGAPIEGGTVVIRRGIIDEGQDDPAPDFGRSHE